MATSTFYSECCKFGGSAPRKSFVEITCPPLLPSGKKLLKKMPIVSKSLH